MNAFLAELIATVLPVALTALAAYIAPAAKRWLAANEHSATLGVLVDALGRAAQLAASRVQSGTTDAPAGAAEMVDYVKANLPGTVAKLAPTGDALASMATAILLQTLAARGVRPVAS